MLSPPLPASPAGAASSASPTLLSPTAAGGLADQLAAAVGRRTSIGLTPPPGACSAQPAWWSRADWTGVEVWCVVAAGVDVCKAVHADPHTVVRVARAMAGYADYTTGRADRDRRRADRLTGRSNGAKRHRSPCPAGARRPARQRPAGHPGAARRGRSGRISAGPRRPGGRRSRRPERCGGRLRQSPELRPGRPLSGVRGPAMRRPARTETAIETLSTESGLTADAAAPGLHRAREFLR